MTATINRAKAKRELHALSRNARMHLQDVLGNDICAIRLAYQGGSAELVVEGAQKFLKDIREMGIFEIDHC